MKKTLKAVLAALLVVCLLLPLAACGNNATTETKLKIAIPNDTTNEARALLLLQDQGYIKLKDGAGITATVLDIVENPKNIEFSEVEAAQLPNLLPDVDYAVINSNYAISAGLNPTKDALALEGSSSAYANILAVKEGNENEPLVKALIAALSSKQVADYITEKYDGSVVSVVENPGDGYDADLDYTALAGLTISVAASPAPHAEILAVAKEILAAKDITLDIQEYSDYVIPNNVVEDGTVLANYFQHTPYLDSFNEENGTHLVSVGAVHYEPFGIYPGKSSDLANIADGATIAVPNDTTNEARALQLLAAQGLITVRDGAGLTATVNDITENPHNVKIEEIEAAQLPRTVQDVDFAVINGNYAIEAGFSVGKDALATEDASSEAAQTYANVLVVKEGNESDPAIQALYAALTSDKVKDYINSTYDGAVVPIF